MAHDTSGHSADSIDLEKYEQLKAEAIRQLVTLPSEIINAISLLVHFQLTSQQEGYLLVSIAMESLIKDQEFSEVKNGLEVRKQRLLELFRLWNFHSSIQKSMSIVIDMILSILRLRLLASDKKIKQRTKAFFTKLDKQISALESPASDGLNTMEQQAAQFDTIAVVLLKLAAAF